MEILEYCTKAEIFDNDGKVLCEAMVSIGPMGSLLLTVPRSLDYLNQEIFRILFYDPTLGRLTCRCALSSPLLLPNQMTSLRCDILERVSQEQRRQDLKVPLKVPTGMDITIHVTRRPGDSLYMTEEGCPARLMNLSAGGAYVRTEVVLEEGRQLWFDFRGAGAPIRLTAQVLRVEDLTAQPNRPLYGYGCKFVGLPARAESQLRSFVFKEERQLYKQKK